MTPKQPTPDELKRAEDFLVKSYSEEIARLRAELAAVKAERDALRGKP